MNYCTNCGQAISVNDKFCASCGTPIAQIPNQADNTPENNTVEGGVIETSNQPAHVPTHVPTYVPTFQYSDSGKRSRITTHVPKNEDLLTSGTVEFGDLHPNATWLFFLNYSAQTWIIPVLTIPGAVFFEMWLWLILVAWLAANYLFAVITYKNYKFEITPSSFRKEYGIVFKQSASIPFDRIQNVNIRRSLLDRMLGISHLEIETAGTGGTKKRNLLGGAISASEGYIPGVAVDEAKDIKELLLARSRVYVNHPAAQGNQQHP
ncbi:MAG: PH domain-containing protein [Candidatus Saccharimonadales bacterium]